MSSSESSHSEDKEVAFSDSSKDDQEVYEDEKNSYEEDYSQVELSNESEDKMNKIQSNIVEDLINKVPKIKSTDTECINLNENENTKSIEDIKTEMDKKNSIVSNLSNNDEEIKVSNIAYSSIDNNTNNFRSFDHCGTKNFNEKGLEPKLPPLHNIKTVSQCSPTSQSPRPQLQPISPTITNNNTLRIIPPPQRRRSPITRRRQINTPKDRNSFRKNYDILKPEPPTEEENRLIKRIIKGETINFDPKDPNSIDLINNLILQLQQLRKQKAIERNYKDGKILNKAISTLEQQRADLLMKMSQDETMRHLDEDYKVFEKRKVEFDNETKKMIKELQMKQKEQKENMQRTHEEKEQRLFHDWTEGKQVNMYNRSSNELTNLRRQHAFLLVQNRFDEAQKIGNEIEQRQNEEMLNSHMEHQKNYDSAYDMLYEKNKEEDEFFENKCAIEMATLIQKRNKEKRAYENKEKWFIKRKNEISDYDKRPLTSSSPRNSASNSFAGGQASYRRPIMPSSKMTRKELGGSDVAIFKLPPIVNRRDTKGKTPNKRK